MHESLTEEAVRRLRSETPGCGRVNHLNNAGAALMPRAVVETVTDYLHREMLGGGYETAAAAHDALEAVYDEIAGLLGAARGEIALAESAGRAWGGILQALPWRAGDRVLVSRSEYVSNYLALLRLHRAHGVTIETIPDDRSGQVSLGALAKAMGRRVRLVSLTHVPTHDGLVNPAGAVGEITRRWDCLYLLDACQSVGQMPVEPAAVACDFLTATGRKFLRGPRGTGFAWVREGCIERLDPPLPDMRSAEWLDAGEYRLRGDARRLESWEHGPALRLGLGRAVRLARDIGPAAIRERLAELAGRLRAGLAAVEGITVLDRGERQSAIVTFGVADWPAGVVVDRLRERGIQCSVSVPGTSRLDIARARVRASPHYYNTADEIDALVAAVESLVASGPG